MRAASRLPRSKGSAPKWCQSACRKAASIRCSLVPGRARRGSALIGVTPFGLARRMVNWMPVPGMPEGEPRCLIMSGSVAILVSLVLADLVLGLRLEVRSVVALVQLCRGIAGGGVDHGAALDGGPLADLVRPSPDVLVFVHRQEIADIVIGVLCRKAAVPRPDRHVRDRILVSGHVFVVRQMAVEDVHLALYLHGVAIDGIFDLHRRIGVKVPKAAAE